MNMAVLSDIHGNYVALKRCLDYAKEQGIDTYIFLGDYLGEMAYPQKTMNMLYDLAKQHTCYFVKGNREDYWIDYRVNGETGWKQVDSTTGSLYYTYHSLTEKDMDFFSHMKISDRVEIEGMQPLTICHGSPRNTKEKLLPDMENTYELMKSDASNYILCGHTHLQGVIEHGGKKVLNPGAVGVPLGSDGKIQFLILHSHGREWQEEFISLDYDVQQVIQDLHDSGLDRLAPCWCKVSEYLLIKGYPSHGSVLTRAMQYCEEEMGYCHWPEVPEKYWEKAVEEMLQEREKV